MYALKREVEAKIVLKSEFYSLDGGVAGLLGRESLYKNKANVLGDSVSYAGDAIRTLVNEILELQVKLQSSVNVLPRRIEAEGVKIFLPGSAVKGVFRSALDLFGIRDVEGAYQDTVYRAVEELRRRFNLQERHALAASLISKTSWLLAEWGDASIDNVAVGTLGAVKSRRKVAEVICQSRGGANDCMEEIHHRLFLGLSELVFGTTGLRGAVVFSDFVLDGEVESYIKTYIAVAKQGYKAAVPFKLEHLRPGAVFKGKISIYSTPFISAEEVYNALSKAVEIINEGEMSIGGRGSVGFGRVEIRLG